jgi:hypothetical protein
MFALSAKPLSGRYLSFMEREQIGLLRAQGHTMQEVGAGSIDDLPRAAAQRRHPKRRPGISRHDSAMARRAIFSPPEAGEACSQCCIASLCGGTTGWRGRRSKRRSCSRPDRALERPSAWTTARPAVGKRLEPGQIARRLPIDFPDDEAMRISHEDIYQALFVQG